MSIYLNLPRQNTKHKTSSPRIIPPEEDMRRLFQECKVGKGNASLLSEALAYAKPEDLKHKSVIKVKTSVCQRNTRIVAYHNCVQEFYARCRASQELIYAQIPWASANAERSRQAAGRESPVVRRKNSAGTPRSNVLSIVGEPEDAPGLTVEEQLLAALLNANEELTEALRLYDDLERVKIEREAERRSKKETRMDPRVCNDDAHSSMSIADNVHIAETSDRSFRQLRFFGSASIKLWPQWAHIFSQFVAVAFATSFRRGHADYSFAYPSTSSYTAPQSS